LKTAITYSPCDQLTMTWLDELARCLLAAGGALPMGSDGMYLLYVEDSALVLKHWNGETFDSEEFIAESVLPTSPAPYLTTPTGRLVVCISSSSTLCALKYDDDSAEWIDEESFGQHKVHPKGRVAGSITAGRRNIYYLNSSKQLVHLDSSWESTVLPVNAVEDSPLATSSAGGKLHLFYVSANDNYVHYVTQQQVGSWTDTICTKYAFSANEKPKRFLASPDGSGGFELFVLTEEKALLRISADGQKKSLGTVNVAGEYVPATKEEAIVKMPHQWDTVEIYF